MNSYRKLYNLINEWMSDEDRDQYAGRPSRKKVKKKASRIRLRSKRTQAAIDRAKAKEEAEAKAETEAYRSGGRGR